MKIKCDNADNGCEWINELRSLDEHLIICDYVFLCCRHVLMSVKKRNSCICVCLPDAWR